MLTLFKKLFGKSAKKTVGPLIPPTTTPTATQMQFESAIQMAKVEVAKLSLKAIVAKFPEDVRGLLNSAPDDTATVALPIQTILKQLPQGIVRMSLASLHRQAPQGLFKPMQAGDKRMVEVPLAEVFKHVRPTAFKRRNDQRSVQVIDEELELPVFNNRKEPAPTAAAVESVVEIEDIDEVEENAVAEPAPNAMRVVAPPSELSMAAAPKAPPVAKAAKAKAALAKATPAKAAPSAAAASNEPTLVLPFAKISESWTEEITGALQALDAAANVAIPHSCIAPGLARGKISFSWKQLQGWLTPPAPKNVTLDPETVLVLPLKLIAPAFLASTKTPGAQRKSVAVDETIPALFSGGRPHSPEAKATQAPAKPPAEPESVAPAGAIPAEKSEANDAPAAEAPAEEPTLATPQSAEASATAEAPTTAAPESSESKGEEPAETPPAATAETVETPAAEEPPAAAEAPSSPAPAQTISEILGEPDRTEWTPSALVNAIVKLNGVAGAIVALQEGFQVAHALPDGVNAETVSAFLPQIFTRLNQYAGEMKLGEVDDLLFTTRGAHCLIYRLGTVYLAVLGKPGESLPWNALRLAAAELSRQVKK